MGKGGLDGGVHIGRFSTSVLDGTDIGDGDCTLCIPAMAQPSGKLSVPIKAGSRLLAVALDRMPLQVPVTIRYDGCATRDAPLSKDLGTVYARLVILDVVRYWMLHLSRVPPRKNAMPGLAMRMSVCGRPGFGMLARRRR